MSDLRYLWMRQKRLQGSHFANDDPGVAPSTTWSWMKQDRPLPFAHIHASTRPGDCHQLMYENRHPDGNMAILVGAPREGMTTIE
jgi:crotonyl-CoA carboxylase/reductase